MNKIFMINAHQPYPFSEGRLNRSLVERATEFLQGRGYELKHTNMIDEFDVDEEIEKHVWADTLLIQSPVNWMGVPWSFKRYIDHVYSAGMDGRLCSGDGRTRSDPNKQYGTGGTLQGTRAMLSLTFNAPEESFNDPKQSFFEGRSIDDLFWSMHLNFRFFGIESLPSFACYDVMKNPSIEDDFLRFDAHLAKHFPKV